MILLAIALAALPRPNIVLITIDSLRADHLGSYGAARGSTPALDALASEGLRFERGDFRSAQPLFEELASRDILSFEVHLYLARCDRLDGKLADAIREYEAAAVIYDGYSVLHLEHGRALLASGNLEGAAAAFEKSLALAPSSEAETGLATAARKLGDRSRAIAALRRARALDPEDADSWNELGALLLQGDEVGPAVAAFERAVALRPADEMFRRNLEFARGIRTPREK